MQLSDAFWKMAEHLMDVVHSETGFPVLLYDHKGVIVRATDPSRIDGPRAEKMGISALLMKTLNLSDLALNIRRVLDRRKGRP
jgi:hypothetical protein